MRTGRPIVYTSADSVFQIAAHEDVIPVPELYRICEIAYDQVGKGMNVGRVIARPFVGAPGAFRRTANRHDYALPPSGTTLLEQMLDAHPGLQSMDENPFFNRLADPLRRGTVTTAELANVQRRRMPPTVVVQGMQRFLHARVLSRALAGDIDIANREKPPVPMRVIERFPKLRAIPAYAIGYGVRPEHAPDFARR